MRAKDAIRPARGVCGLRTVAIMAALALIACLSACSTKKNTAYSRNYQAFITRYNVYYNGDQHFRETLRDMERLYEDDYSQRLFMHPAEAKQHPKSPQPQGNFDRSIEKAQKAIQLHSIKKRPKRKGGKNTPEQKAWLKRSEYNPFLHNAWMMMGRSQYYNGDFAGAASTFMYVGKNFTWLPATVTETHLWEAMSYCAMDWLYEAELIINRVKPEQLTNKTLKELYAFAKADLLVRQRNYEQAAPALREALKYASGPQKIRLNFLLGQVLSTLGQKQEAYEAFKKAGSNVNAPYRTKLNARIKQSEVYTGSDIAPEVKALQRMTRYDRNKDYLDQIYYAIGNLYLSRGDTLQAIENYKLATEKSTRSGIDKAINQVTLGGLYFDRRQYDLAQPCYSEGVPPLPDDYPDLALLKRRSDVLDELAVYSQNVQLQDSLLRLAAMDSTQRMAVIDKIIADLVKAEKEAEKEAAREAYMAEHEGDDAGFAQGAAGSAPSSFTMNTDDSWYFYNRQAVSQGKTEFQRRWGARKLEDNWRRRNKATFSFEEETEEETDEAGGDSEAEQAAEVSEEDATAQARVSDPHYPEYYLAQIPFTPEAQGNANDVIQEGLYNMGVILKDKLEDFPAAAIEFNELLTRYPDNVYRLDTYYNLYLMYARAGNEPEAERWRKTLVAEFPESPYGIAMQTPGYIDRLRAMARVEEATYRQAFDDYMANNNGAVHHAYDYMSEEYPLSKLMPKFMFLNALAYVTENKPEEFAAALRELLERYPSTEMTPMATAYTKGLAEGRKLNSGSSNTRGMLWSTRLLAPSDSLSAAGAATGEGGAPQFALNPSGPHSLLLLYEPAGERGVITNALLYNVARYNFMTYNVRDFDLETYSFPPLAILAVKGLDGEDEANAYRRGLMSAPEAGVPADRVRPVVISDANFDAMLRSGASFDDYFRFIGDTVAVQTHESVLPPEEFEAQEEMYDALREAAQSEAEPELPATPEPEPEAELPIEPEPVILPEPAPAVEPASANPSPFPAIPSPANAPAKAPANEPEPDGSEGPDSLLDD